MKILNTKTMRKFLDKGVRKARKMKAPSDGSMYSLNYKTSKNGWHYQVEFINDSRFRDNPYVVVYAFKPPRVYFAKSADYFLEKELV